MAVKMKRKQKVNYLVQDWPDNMQMDENMFEQYARRLEYEDFEDEVFGLTGSAQQLVAARRDTIAKLRGSADYLDSIWLRCRVSRTMGTSASMVGGGLTIAGGILTTLTAGAAAPVLIAGIATSSVGAATNIGTSVIEKILNSRQIKEMNAALERDKDITLKLESQIDDIRRYKDSAHLSLLLLSIEKLLGSDHLIFTVLQGILLYDLTSAFPFSGALTAKGFQSAESIATAAVTAAANKTAAVALAQSAANPAFIGEASAAVVGSCAAAATAVGIAAESSLSAAAATGAAVVADGSLAVVSTSGKETTVALLKETSRDGVKYNPLDAGVFVESGKVIGQNSIRVAGQVIIGISAAFLVWDAIDLGFTISDLVRKQGSQAAKTLREKAELLEVALEETMHKYSLRIPD